MRPCFESVRVKIWLGHTCASAWSACSKARALPAAAHCSRRKISLIRRERFSRAWFTPVSHRTRKSRAEAARMQSGSSARPLCFHSACQQEREGARSPGFGFQTKVKDRFLIQRRWTCWYSCRENMQVLSATDSLVWLFVFVLKSLSLQFTSCYTMEALLIFFILLLFDSSVFAKHSVMY